MGFSAYSMLPTMPSMSSYGKVMNPTPPINWNPPNAAIVTNGKVSGPVAPKVTVAPIPSSWGPGVPISSGVLNPGLIQQAASQADYKTTNPTQAQFYWGARPVVKTQADLANYKQLPPGAPTTPWGTTPVATPAAKAPAPKVTKGVK